MNTIKIHGTTFSETKFKNNILKAYKQSEILGIDGLLWYKEANNFAQKALISYNNTSDKKLYLRHICGILSALSPLSNWNRNKDLLIIFLNNLTFGINNAEKLPYLKLGTNKAIKIAKLELPLDILISNILKGEKIKAFYDNILNPLTSDKVTIDRHALSILLGIKLSSSAYGKYNPTKKQNEFFQRCYKLAAKDLDITGLECQSQTWESLRFDSEITLKHSINLLKIK